MNNLIKTIFIFLTMGLVISSLEAAEHSQDEGHSHEKAAQNAGGHGHEDGVIALAQEQMRQGGLKIERVELAERPEILRAPGVVRNNDYKTADVSSLIDAIVVKRHVRLGELVRKGQKLLTLKSTALAQAEADWIRAKAEYRKNKQEFERIKPLAEDGIVSQARLQQSRSAYESARAQLLATRSTLISYGLTERDINDLESGKKLSLVTLRAPIEGTVVADNVVLGQHIAAGALLMRIINEESVWVEVNLPPDELGRIQNGAKAMISIKEKGSGIAARVVGIHHEVDPTTRTALVRLEADNTSHVLHAGMFVEAEITIGHGEMSMLLPVVAVQRQGSETIVFIEEEPGRFERREVKTRPAGMGFVEVLGGLKVGERVVTRGAFVLLSELLKSGFEAHNH
ncbi:MAG: efflux RND transporter periplasmic adaptor subunit [Bacteroidetes bacterium]|nr:MAG: efflux RND transporter periplasmic adaptor subunit [Bacteroidota bacterium]